MSYRHLAVTVLTLAGSTTAAAQSAPQRIAGPALTSVAMRAPTVPGTRVTSAARGHEAMHRARRHANVTGGIIGFVVGAAAGATVGCLANKDDYGVFCAGQNDTKVVVGALVGGVAGAAVGALLFKRH
jgi:hypothetical protein